MAAQTFVTTTCGLWWSFWESTGLKKPSSNPPAVRHRLSGRGRMLKKRRQVKSNLHAKQKWLLFHFQGRTLGSMCSDSARSREAWRRSSSSEASVTAGRINWRKLKVHINSVAHTTNESPRQTRKIHCNLRTFALIQLNLGFYTTH